MPAEPRMSGVSTRAVHAGSPDAEPGGSVVTPIHQTSTFFSHPGGEGPVRYTRYGNNPTQEALERRIAALERAEACVATGSGMAAMAAALLSCLRAGDHVLCAREVYGGTHRLLTSQLAELGVETDFVDQTEPGWRAALRPSTRVVLAEVPSNPLLRVADLPDLAAGAREAGAALVVDATFATPVNLQALGLGADLVVHSATKFLGGHTDVTAGVVCGAAERLAAVREVARVWGFALDPHAAWLLERGIKTLAVRMERHNANGLAVARWCESRPGVERVHYPGLQSHPDHERAAALLRGFGGMMGLKLRGGGKAADRFVAALRLARVAPSLGGVETLVSEPRYTSHAALPPEQREALGIGGGFVRFSLGIEDAEDIVDDIGRALDAAQQLTTDAGR